MTYLVSESRTYAILPPDLHNLNLSPTSLAVGPGGLQVNVNKLTIFRRQVLLLTFCLSSLARKRHRRQNICERLRCQKVQQFHRHISGQCYHRCRSSHCPRWFTLVVNSTTYMLTPVCTRLLLSRKSGLTRRMKICGVMFYRCAYLMIKRSGPHKSYFFMVQTLALAEPKWSTLNHPNICRTWSLTSSNQPTTAVAMPWFGNGNIVNFMRQHQGIDKLLIVCPVICLEDLIFLIVISGQASR